MADADIDLYADVEGDFAGEDFGNDSRDLYDDVLSHPKEENKGTVKPEPLSPPPGGAGGRVDSGISSQAHQGKRYQLYIGNLTWWTTDNDIQEAIAGCGVSDFQEVKFNENRINGQSKGFCCVSLGSEGSMRSVMEKLVKQELHGQAPVVTYATKTALLQFEAQSKTRTPQPSQQQQQQQQQAPPSMPPGPRVSAPPPAPLRGYAPRPTYVRGPPPPHMISAPPPIIHHAPPPIIPPPTAMIVGPPPMMGSMPPRGPPPIIHPAGPAPHVNPAFFPQGPPGYPPPLHHGLSEAEFEEIMSRNRTVSSSAIARAVQDASNNEYASAIETLVTAISLIKQSKVANDDRCKILVASLQDTLTGIENKSYSTRRERSRSRERAYRPSHRSYSREREYRPRGEYRERSRERDREYYRDREREYYEERQRYKERERMERERERESGGGQRMRGGEGEMERERERVEVRGGEREKEREQRSRH